MHPAKGLALCVQQFNTNHMEKKQKKMYVSCYDLPMKVLHLQSSPGEKPPQELIANKVKNQLN